MMAHSYDPIIQEPKTGGSQVQDQPELHSEFQKTP